MIQPNRMTVRDQLQGFLYILLREHLPFGAVEEILAKHVEKSVTGYSFCEPVIAEYAGTLAFSRKLYARFCIPAPPKPKPKPVPKSEPVVSLAGRRRFTFAAKD
jgi:hypothetical protein